jgi:hypothetical protein
MLNLFGYLVRHLLLKHSLPWAVFRLIFPFSRRLAWLVLAFLFA